MSQTAPSITSIAFDQPSYVAGQVINATVTYVPGASDQTFTFSDTATDTSSAETATLTADFIVTLPDPTTNSGTDTGGRTWTLVSDTGTVAVFQSVA